MREANSICLTGNEEIPELFFFSGATMVNMVGGPMWFCVADLVLAYIPMSYIGGVLAARRKLSAT